MQKTVNIYEAKTHFSALIAEAMAGGDIIIARNGEPCVRLVPVRPPGQVPLGFLRPPTATEAVFPIAFDDEDMDEWEAEWDEFYPR
jgi:prevent-host-death family protein